MGCPPARPSVCPASPLPLLLAPAPQRAAAEPSCPSVRPSRCPSVLPALRFAPVCLQNYIPPQSLTLSCPVCRQTSILPERGVAALQNNFFITNLMEVLQRDPDSCGPHPGRGLDPVSAVTGQPLSCPNHEGGCGGS
uniref:Uncharacterized protein n=1 Tax=Strix occidentalis caurina TaxID=311401 RepID=A0A8D0FEW5_STROC